MFISSKKVTLLCLSSLLFLTTSQSKAHNGLYNSATTFSEYFTQNKSYDLSAEVNEANYSLKQPFIVGKKADGPKVKHVVSVCIPKSGTHLLSKCIALFGVQGIVDYKKTIKPSPQKLAHIRALNKFAPPRHYKGEYYPILSGGVPKALLYNLIKPSKVRKHLWTHWAHTPRFEKYLQHFKTYNFLMIRDPRDMVVSFAFMVYQSRTADITHVTEKTQSAELENVILDLVTGNQKHYLPWAVEIQQVYPLLWEIGLYKFYKLYMPFFYSSDFLVVRFEDLIGERGGGSSQKQLDSIKKIGRHMRVPISDQEIKSIIEKLFGGTWTFREGQIGSWKKYFTPRIKEAFKNRPELLQLLISLGYEKDFSWIKA